MQGEPKKELIEVIKKIPLFTGLAPSQIRRVLSICVSRTCEPEDRICVSGLPSDEMYILISGQLAIVTGEGLRVATIDPVTTVGEMGVMTGHPRSATVEVVAPSRVLVLQKNQFDFLLRNHEDIRVKTYQSIIQILSDKLINDNVRLRDYVAEKSRYDAHIKELNHKIAAAVGLLEDKGVDRAEAEEAIAVKVREIPPLILIVDDEEDLRRVVRSALHSYAVVEAGDGQEAIESIEEERPDLVVADIRMPRMDGYELLAHLRQDYPDLPVLAISGYVDGEEIEKYDFDGFVEKPLKMEDFRSLIDQTLAGREN